MRQYFAILISVALLWSTAIEASAAVTIKSSQNNAPAGVAPLTASQKSIMLGTAAQSLTTKGQAAKAKAVIGREKRMAADASSSSAPDATQWLVANVPELGHATLSNGVTYRTTGFSIVACNLIWKTNNSNGADQTNTVPFSKVTQVQHLTGSDGSAVADIRVSAAGSSIHQMINNTYDGYVSFVDFLVDSPHDSDSIVSALKRLATQCSGK